MAIGGGMLAIGAGYLLQMGLGPGSDWPSLIAGFVVAGIGVGLATPTLASAAMAAVPPARAGMAAGAVNTARQLGLALGIGALGSVYDARVGPHGGADALGTTFLAAGAAGLAAGAIALILIRRPAEHASGLGARGPRREVTVPFSPDRSDSRDQGAAGCRRTRQRTRRRSCASRRP